MDKATRTYRDIIRFIEAATEWQRSTTKKDSPMTGFRYAIGRVLKSTAGDLEDYNGHVADYNIDASSVDEKGNIINDGQGGAASTKDAVKCRNRKIRQLKDTEVEIGVYIAKVVPDDLTPFQLQAFEGFVIPETKDPEVENHTP